MDPGVRRADARRGGDLNSIASVTLPLPFRAAYHTLGDQVVDLARRISKFRQHRGRVLAEFRRHVAQTWLAARKPDRGGDALVPVLFDDIAAMDGMGAGQRLVDRLHRSGRQSGGKQPIAQRFGVVLAEYGGELGAQRIAVGDTVLVARKTRIGPEFGLADLLG